MKAQDGFVKLKEAFDNHPVPWGLGLIASGFIAGFSARGYVLPISPASLSCSIEGLPALEGAHSKSLDTLNRQLVSLESSATDRITARSDQELFEKAADRIRQDIERSNRAYLAAMESLNKKCR